MRAFCTFLVVVCILISRALAGFVTRTPNAASGWTGGAAGLQASGSTYDSTTVAVPTTVLNTSALVASDFRFNVPAGSSIDGVLLDFTGQCYNNDANATLIDALIQFTIADGTDSANKARGDTVSWVFTSTNTLPTPWPAPDTLGGNGGVCAASRVNRPA